MKTKKRLLSLVLACTLSAGMLTGCGEGKTDLEKVESDAALDEDSDAVSSDLLDAESGDEIKAEDEYLSIDTSVLCNRELRDFFMLYIKCYAYYYMEGGLPRPESISEMLQYGNIVGSLVLDEGMRIVSDYDDDDFAGLELDGHESSKLHTRALQKDFVNCSVSVTLQDKNFDDSVYRYKIGTDAEIQLIVSVTYTVSDGSKQSQITKDYAVFLVNNNSTPEEWLIEGIFPADFIEGKDTYYWSINDSSEVSKRWKTMIYNEDETAVEDIYKEYLLSNGYGSYFEDTPTDDIGFVFKYISGNQIPELVIHQGNSFKVLSYCNGMVKEISLTTYEEEAGGENYYNYQTWFWYKEDRNEICYVSYYKEAGKSDEYEKIVQRIELVDGEVAARYEGTEVSYRVDVEGSTWHYTDYTRDGIVCERDEYEEFFEKHFRSVSSGNKSYYSTIEEAALNIRKNFTWKEEKLNITKEDELYTVVQSYQDYVSNHVESGMDYYEFNFIYLNDDDIPDLLVASDYQREVLTLLSYQDGELYVNELFAKGGFYYKERGNSICYETYDSESPSFLIIEKFMMDIIDYKLVEIHNGKCIEYYDDEENVVCYIDGVECSKEEYTNYFGEDFNFPIGMKSGWENSWFTINEAFNALGI